MSKKKCAECNFEFEPKKNINRLYFSFMEKNNKHERKVWFCNKECFVKHFKKLIEKNGNG